MGEGGLVTLGIGRDGDSSKLGTAAGVQSKDHTGGGVLEGSPWTAAGDAVEGAAEAEIRATEELMHGATVSCSRKTGAYPACY